MMSLRIRSRHGVADRRWSGRPRTPAATFATVVIVVVAVALLLFSAVPVSASGAGATPASRGAALRGSASPVATSAAGPASANCSALAAGWSLLGAPYYPPDVASSLQGPCLLGHDVPGLYLLSNASASGSRFEMVVTLPGAATAPGTTYAAFWVGLWVGGVPCSYGAASYLMLELLPPHSALAQVPDSNNWSLGAPVWSLTPPGSCDPQCQNDTAFLTVAGRSFCEDDAVLNGVGSLAGVQSGRFAPGDTLSLAFVGSGTSPLTIFANDTTHAAASLNFSYPATSTISGRPLTPLFSSSSASSVGWTGGGDVGFGWLNCPLPNATGPVGGCNSYDGTVASVAGTPQVDLVLSWSAAKHTYSVPYPELVTMSSSGACSGANGTTPCSSFEDHGGTASYPDYSIDAAGGRSWLEYGPPGPDRVSDFGGVATQFPADGNLSGPATTTALSNLRVTVGSSAVTVTARLSDPYGIAHVAVSSWWCSSAGLRVPATVLARPSNASGNTPADGNWSANLPTNSHIGQFFYWVSATSDSGATTGPLFGNVTVTGTGANCLTSASVPQPVINATTVEPVGGGYVFSWTENLSAGVIAYTASATPTLGGTTVSMPLGNVTSVRFEGLKGNATYNLRVAAFNPAGGSAISASTAAPRTDYPLATRPLNVSVSSTWVNLTSAKIVANVTGGMPAFTFFFDFGDGTNASVFTVSGEASVTHPFPPGYSGVARIVVRVADALGDTVTTPAAYVDVLAVPLAPSASLAGGNGFALLRWNPAVAPPGLTVTGYLVFYTTDPAWAPYLSAAWPSNANFPAIGLSATPLLQVSLPVPNGMTLYAQVVALDAYGPGLLPSEPAPGAEPVLFATAAPFASTGIELETGGGTAPFTAQFATEFTTATNTYVVNATYRFTGGSSVVAPITGANGRFWANASELFDTPGLRAVLLYATDSVSELLILTSSIYVAPAAGPVVSIAVAPTAIFANTSVDLHANTTGGSGQYAFNWTLGDGLNASGPSVSTSYAATGFYLVTVVATDTVYGGVTVASTVVAVHSVATVAIGIVPTSTAGEYDLAAFATGGFGNLSYTWLFGDGTEASGVNVTHIWVTPGTYTIQVRVSDPYGHSTLATTTLTVVYPSSGSSSSTGGFTGLDVILLIAVIVIAVALAVVLARERRRRNPPAQPDESQTYDGEAPTPSLEEESPAGPG